MADGTLRGAKFPAGSGYHVPVHQGHQGHLKPVVPATPAYHARPTLPDVALPECMFCGETVVGHADATLIIPVQFRFIPGKGVIAIPHPDVKLIYDVLPNGQVYFSISEGVIGGYEDICTAAHCDCHNAAITGEYGHFEDLSDDCDDGDPTGRRSRDEDFIGDSGTSEETDPDEIRGIYG